MAKSDKDKKKKNEPLESDVISEDTENVVVLYCPEHEDEMVLDDTLGESSPVCDECGGVMVSGIRTLKKDKVKELRAKKIKKDKDK